MESGNQFCPVCCERMVLQIHRRVDPIDAHLPATVHRRREAIPVRDEVRFEVTVLQPKTHDLTVTWHVLSANAAIQPTTDARLPDRLDRGPLQPLADRGDRSQGVGGRHRFRIGARSLEPGWYQVVCRVRDDAKPSGQAWAWVLKDDAELLQSERVWWIDVPPR